MDSEGLAFVQAGTDDPAPVSMIDLIDDVLAFYDQSKSICDSWIAKHVLPKPH